MRTRQDPPESATWHTEGRTTLVLQRDTFGRWRATQDGVDEYGHGETAQRAAADYCRSLAATDDESGARGGRR